VLAAHGAAVEFALDPFEGLERLRQQGGVVNLPELLRCEANPRAIGTTPFVGTAEGGGGRPGGGHQLGNR